MRQVRVPNPSAAWELRCEGPFSPSVADSTTARARLDEVLAALPRLDTAQGGTGWTAVWRSAVLVSGAALRLWLWCARSDRGADVLRSLATHAETAGFTPRLAPRTRAADTALEPTVVYARSGALRIGLDPRTEPMVREVEFVEEDRGDVDFGQRFRFAAQACPRCRVVDHPASLVAGFPSPDLMLAAELGEVAFAEGGLVDGRSRMNARCRGCGADFMAR